MSDKKDQSKKQSGLEGFEDFNFEDFDLEDTPQTSTGASPAKNTPSGQQASKGEQSPKAEEASGLDIEDDFDLSDFEMDEQEPKVVDAETVLKDSAKPKDFKDYLDLGLEVVKKNWIYAVGGIIAIVIGWYMISGILGGDTPSQPHRPQPQQQQPNFGSLQGANDRLPPPKEPAKTVEKIVTSGDLSTKSIDSLLKGTQSIVNYETSQVQSQLSGQLQGFQKAVNTQLTDTQKFLKESVEGTLKFQNTQKTQIADLTKSVDKLQTSLKDLNQQFDSYNKNLAAIVSTLGKTQAELELVLAQKAQDTEKYTLRAVVPGQAWLVNASGQTVTVSVGSSLGNYGKVTRIDSDAGKVYMSSGYVFS